MAYLGLKGITKHFGAVNAVDYIDLEIPSGELVSFLGPSGCGKTTLLRLIAGLETPDRGQIFLGNRDITGLPTHQRDIGMVFQSLALFPHMTVGENIAYALRIQGIPKSQQEKQVNELLEMVCLPGVKSRKISQLSGGQQQRVAIARALAHHPKLLLLDEPLSALDAKLREAMQLELRLLQQRLGITTILVTHDQQEAMTMSDRVVVMNEGSIRQVGTPLEIYRQPTDPFVADFIGTNNLLRGVVRNQTAIEVEGMLFTGWQLGDRFSPGQQVSISVRPEDVTLLPRQSSGQLFNHPSGYPSNPSSDHSSNHPLDRLSNHSSDHSSDRLSNPPSDHSSDHNCIPGTVTFIRDVGSSVEIHLDCRGRKVISTVLPKARPALAQGDPVTASFSAHSCIILQ
ncbi:ABC transporter ATP-binding protein [Leptolyngbya ohadii]|uniref:ABC transporter ATP-binding protein n=1 Tax=Leptolyngbya ohadii TaxID=1962290 RepID=UPI000B59F5A9|nr:ABC transporter ATP-binding protein [Leptolyngbya ohadii]